MQLINWWLGVLYVWCSNLYTLNTLFQAPKIIKCSNNLFALERVTIKWCFQNLIIFLKQDSDSCKTYFTNGPDFQFTTKDLPKFPSGLFGHTKSSFGAPQNHKIPHCFYITSLIKSSIKISIFHSLYNREDWIL